MLQDRAITRVGGHESIKLNIRIIAATNKDLEKMVKEGKFRKIFFTDSMWYHLKCRGSGIVKRLFFMLITHFMNKYNQENGSYKEISDNAINIFPIIIGREISESSKIPLKCFASLLQIM